MLSGHQGPNPQVGIVARHQVLQMAYVALGKKGKAGKPGVTVTVWRGKTSFCASQTAEEGLSTLLPCALCLLRENVNC